MGAIWAQGCGVALLLELFCGQKEGVHLNSWGVDLNICMLISLGSFLTYSSLFLSSLSDKVFTNFLHLTVHMKLPQNFFTPTLPYVIGFPCYIFKFSSLSYYSVSHPSAFPASKILWRRHLLSLSFFCSPFSFFLCYLRGGWEALFTVCPVLTLSTILDVPSVDELRWEDMEEVNSMRVFFKEVNRKWN